MKNLKTILVIALAALAAALMAIALTAQAQTDDGAAICPYIQHASPDKVMPGCANLRRLV